jgi:hypothetical protein
MLTYLSAFKDADSFYDPQGFTTVQCVYIGLGLKDAKSGAASRMYRIAKKLRTHPDISNAAEIIETFPGCEYLSERI